MRRKFYIFLLSALLISTNIIAQRTSDTIKTNKGDLIVTPIEHATFVLSWGGKTIYVDPIGGANAFSNFSKPDIILVTDIHGDHFDLKTIEAISTSSTKIIAPQAVADKLPESLKTNLVTLSNTSKTKQRGIAISAVPMYNLPESDSAMHVKGRGNGYLLKTGNKTIYISGDTEDIPEMRALRGIDVAFVCMNLPYTMDIHQAASAVLVFKPKTVYPYHYRGKDGLSDVGQFKELVNTVNKSIDVKLLKWY